MPCLWNTEYLVKPFTVDELAMAIERVSSQLEKNRQSAGGSIACKERSQSEQLADEIFHQNARTIKP